MVKFISEWPLIEATSELQILTLFIGSGMSALSLQGIQYNNT